MHHISHRWLALAVALMFVFVAAAQDVKVSLSVSNSPVEQVLRQLETESGYRFYYNN